MRVVEITLKNKQPVLSSHSSSNSGDRHVKMTNTVPGRVTYDNTASDDLDGLLFLSGRTYCSGKISLTQL